MKSNQPLSFNLWIIPKMCGVEKLFVLMFFFKLVTVPTDCRLPISFDFHLTTYYLSSIVFHWVATFPEKLQTILKKSRTINADYYYWIINCSRAVQRGSVPALHSTVMPPHVSLAWSAMHSVFIQPYTFLYAFINIKKKMVYKTIYISLWLYKNIYTRGIVFIFKQK